MGLGAADEVGCQACGDGLSERRLKRFREQIEAVLGRSVGKSERGRPKKPPVETEQHAGAKGQREIEGL